MSHMQNDIAKAVGVRAIVFTEPALLTASANDDGYENTFERPVRLWSKPGDLPTVFSSACQSENIRRAARTALKPDSRLITFPDSALTIHCARWATPTSFYAPSQFYGFV